MRLIATVFFCLVATPVFSANLQGQVFGYECNQIDPAKDGFRCKVETTNETMMYLHLTENIKKLPKEEAEYKSYRFYSTILRYFQLGGRSFYLTADHWKKGTKQFCSRSKQSIYSYSCN